MKKMPSTYAHYRFGQEVLKELPNDIKKIIIENSSIQLGEDNPYIVKFKVDLKI